MNKAQVIRQFGGPNVFELIDLPIPPLKPGQVLIKMHATSVNPIDCKIRSGKLPSFAPDFPAVLQGDIAGVIEEMSTTVVGFKKGDEVYGCIGGVKGYSGALAEFVVADSELLAKKPHSLSMIEAAALPLVSITAWQALFDKAKILPSQNVLIQGGRGGVGHIAVQLAKWYGATVSATILKENDREVVRAFGADHIINAKKTSVVDYVNTITQGHGFDVIFDTVGGETLDHSLEAAALNGTVVTTSARAKHDLSLLHNKALTLQGVFMLIPLLTKKNRQQYGVILKKISELVDQGKLKPLIDPHQFTLATVGEAHTLVESGAARGKVVIKFDC